MALRVLVWTIRVVLALVFLVTASGKFDPTGNMAGNFARWGYNLEILFFVGSIFLVLLMIGAIVTHFRFQSELGLPSFNVLILIGIVVIVIATLGKDKVSAGKK